LSPFFIVQNRCAAAVCVSDAKPVLLLISSQLHLSLVVVEAAALFTLAAVVAAATTTTTSVVREVKYQREHKSRTGPLSCHHYQFIIDYYQQRHDMMPLRQFYSCHTLIGWARQNVIQANNR
jgi:uncharacterized protein (DUF305 family)